MDDKKLKSLIDDCYNHLSNIQDNDGGKKLFNDISNLHSLIHSNNHPKSLSQEMQQRIFPNLKQ